MWGISFDTPWIYRFDKTNGAIIDSIARCVNPGYGLTQNNQGFWLNGTSTFNSDRVHLFNAITGTGAIAAASADETILFPQPSSDHITIRSPIFEGEEIRISIHDVPGSLIQSCTVHSFSGELKLPIYGLSKGVYSFRLGSNTRSVSGRFVKQ